MHLRGSSQEGRDGQGMWQRQNSQLAALFRFRAELSIFRIEVLWSALTPVVQQQDDEVFMS
jgi:hypothetical protein